MPEETTTQQQPQEQTQQESNQDAEFLDMDTNESSDLDELFGVEGEEGESSDDDFDLYGDDDEDSQEPKEGEETKEGEEPKEGEETKEGEEPKEGEEGVDESSKEAIEALSKAYNIPVEKLQDPQMVKMLETNRQIFDEQKQHIEDTHKTKQQLQSTLIGSLEDINMLREAYGKEKFLDRHELIGEKKTFVGDLGKALDMIAEASNSSNPDRANELFLELRSNLTDEFNKLDKDETIEKIRRENNPVEDVKAMNEKAAANLSLLANKYPDEKPHDIFVNMYKDPTIERAFASFGIDPIRAIKDKDNLENVYHLAKVIDKGLRFDESVKQAGEQAVTKLKADRAKKRGLAANPSSSGLEAPSPAKGAPVDIFNSADGHFNEETTGIMDSDSF